MRYRRSAQMQQRLQDRRDRIVRATRKLIARGGFAAAPVASVARGAGLSTGAIYRHFPSQAALFIEVLVDAVTREIEILEQITRRDEAAPLRLRQAVESFAARALEGRNLAYAFIAEPLDAAVSEARIRCRRDFGAVFERLLQDGVARGELPAQDVTANAACIVGAFTEALTGPIAPGQRMTRPAERRRLVDAIAGFCVSAVTAVRPPIRAKSPSRPRAAPGPGKYQ